MRYRTACIVMVLPTISSTGPARSIHIQKGPHRGRLIVPADYRGGTKWNLHAA